MPVVFDHLAAEAFDERYRLIADYYEARCEQRNVRASQDSAPYHPLAPDMLYLSSDAFFRIQRRCGRRIDFTPFAALPDAGSVKVVSPKTQETRRFAPERNAG